MCRKQRPAEERRISCRRSLRRAVRIGARSRSRQAFSPEAETALGFLRDRIDFPATMFGAAYLGYVGGLFEEGFAAGFPAWLRETNEAMLGRYPFIAEIDENHIAGGAGHLYWHRSSR